MHLFLETERLILRRFTADDVDNLVDLDSDPADRKGSGVRRYEVFRLQDDPNYVMIDLEFDSTPEAEAFVEKMETIWGGPGKSVMQNPTARIAEIIEAKEL